MLVIESMDEDTELRRLSPVALLGDRYIDLNNGRLPGLLIALETVGTLKITALHPSKQIQKKYKLKAKKHSFNFSKHPLVLQTYLNCFLHRTNGWCTK